MKLRVCALILLFAILFLFLCSCGRAGRTELCVSAAPVICWLLVGYDDAASNTDAMALVSLNSASNSITMLQIPRDTYINRQTVQNKINQIYPKALLQAGTGRKHEKRAMEELCSVVSHTFGVKIDGYAAVSTAGISRAVDAVGGVEITLDRALTFEDEYDGTVTVLPEGKQTLDGATAVKFLRFRAGYSNGDLGRMDAQKLFVSAMLKKLSDSDVLSAVIPLINSLGHDMNTNIGRMEMLTCAVCFLPRYRTLEVSFVTLPGRAVMGVGEHKVSYYAANKKACDELLSLGFVRTGAFDPDRIMCEKENKEMTLVYEAQNTVPRIWTKDELTK